MSTHTPFNLIRKHLDVFIFSLSLFVCGFLFGLQPSVGEPIIEQAKNIQINPYETLANTRKIFLNNVFISAALWLGWIATPVFGLQFFPPFIMVYNVGATFGAVAAYVSSVQFLVIMLTFGVLEMLGVVFGMTAGLLLPKYVIKKLVSTASFADYAYDSLLFMFYSAFTLLIGAFFEALLINPYTAVVAVAVGTVITAFTVKLFWTGKI